METVFGRTSRKARWGMIPFSEMLVSVPDHR
jgi:hypothetical protein